VMLVFTEKELKMRRTPFTVQFIDVNTGKVIKVKKVVGELVGGRNINKKRIMNIKLGMQVQLLIHVNNLFPII